MPKLVSGGAVGADACWVVRELAPMTYEVAAATRKFVRRRGKNLDRRIVRENVRAGRHELQLEGIEILAQLGAVNYPGGFEAIQVVRLVGLPSAGCIVIRSHANLLMVASATPLTQHGACRRYVPSPAPSRRPPEPSSSNRTASKPAGTVEPEQRAPDLQGCPAVEPQSGATSSHTSLLDCLETMGSSGTGRVKIHNAL